MSHDAIEMIGLQLAGARSFASVFGQLAPGEARARERALRSSFARLAQLVHPDHVSTGERARAGEVFRDLEAFYKRARDAVSSGTYDQAVSPAVATFVLNSPSGEYELEEKPYGDGDHSYVYRGQARSGAQPVIAKVAVEPAYNPSLEREAQVLTRFAQEPGLRGIARFVPSLLDSFLVTEGARRLRVLVLPHDTGKVSIEDVLEAFPRGLEPEDAGWIARRVMAQALAAESAGLVHGAIVPAHVLIDPLSREPLHIGWAHAQARSPSARILTIIGRERAAYPPEVFAKQQVDARTDIYMAGATILRLFGGNLARKSLPRKLPTPVRESILSCLSDSPARRPQTARAALDGMTRAVRDAWGKTYRPLSLPVRS